MCVHMISLIGCFLILQTASLPVSAQSVWRRQESGTPMNLFTVQFVDALHGFAGGDGGTVLRSDDGGATWQTAAHIFHP